jgi:Ca2+/H+ antiporter
LICGDVLRAAGVVSPVLRYVVEAGSSWVFLTSIVAIAVERAGSAIGGLLTLSYDNTAELVLALFILSRAQTRVFHAQITGSIGG